MGLKSVEPKADLGAHLSFCGCLASHPIKERIHCLTLLAGPALDTASLGSLLGVSEAWRPLPSSFRLLAEFSSLWLKN